MQGEYSPVISHALMAGNDRMTEQKTIVQRIVFELSKVPIKKIVWVLRTKGGVSNLSYVEFTLRSDKIEKFGNKEHQEQGWTYKESSIVIPPYDYIRSISFFGREEVVTPNPAASTATLKSNKTEIRKAADFTGFALDIIP